MAGGNQYAAWVKAKDDLKADPGNKKLEDKVEDARKALNQSHANANTGKYFK